MYIYKFFINEIKMKCTIIFKHLQILMSNLKNFYFKFLKNFFFFFFFFFFILNKRITIYG